MSIAARRRQRTARASTAGSGGTTGVIYRIACGQSSSVTGPDLPVWQADTGYDGGSPDITASNIDLSGVANPAPMSIYQHERYAYGNLTYTINGLTANTAYSIRLHFAESYYSAVGDRVMNISVNGITQITGFDILATAGAQNKAVIKQVSGTAGSSGSLTITFIPTSARNDPKIDGIEVSGNITRDDTPVNLITQPYATYVLLTWSPPSFPTGTVQGYNVYQDGTRVNTSLVTTTSFTPGQQSAALSPSTSYTFKVATVIGGMEKASTTKSITTSAVANPGVAWPLRVSSNNRYLEDQNGKPFLVVAETSWTMLTKLSVADMKWIVDKRKSQGFNTIMTNVEAFSPGSDGPRGTAFVGGDITNWNTSYFNDIDTLIQYAASQDMHIMLNGFWLCNYYEQNVVPSAAAASTFGSKLGMRYKNFPNVSYFIGGDVNFFANSAVTAAIKAYGSALQAAAPNQLITYHSKADYPTTGDAPWLKTRSPQLSYGSVNINSALSSFYNASPTLPAFCSEPPYEPQMWDTSVNNGYRSPQQSRQDFWGGVLAGGYGIAYGGPLNSWFPGNASGQEFGFAPLDKSATTYDREAALSAGAMLTILKQYAWQKLVPDNGATSGGLYSARAGDGTLLIAYTPGSVTFNGSLMRGQCTCQWYNPISGQPAGSLFTMSNSSGQYCASPVGGDGVLVVTA